MYECCMKRKELMMIYSSSSNTSDDVDVAAKAEIASHIFRNYYCCDRYDFDNQIKCENNDGLS